jgi:hypothetical protein
MPLPSNDHVGKMILYRFDFNSEDLDTLYFFW